MTVQDQRAYVEARWERFSLGHRLLIGPAADVPTAYAITVAREEDIRELGEEVEQMADHAHMALERVRDLIDDGEDGESLVAYVRDVCEYTRTWVRLSAILEELKIGWKI